MSTDLYLEARTHRSYASHHKVSSYERLEFLGDALYSALVTEVLYELNPNADEGTLSKKKAGVTSNEYLAKLGYQLGLDAELRLFNAPLSMNIVADAFEAHVAFLYLTEGMEACKALVTELVDFDFIREDPKSRLQEVLQDLGLGLPGYSFDVTNEGLHNPNYTCVVESAGAELGRGIGGSKKAASVAAAQDALSRLKILYPGPELKNHETHS